MKTQIIKFSPDAQERITALSADIANAEMRLHQFVDGVVIGMGIDVHNSDISVNFENMTVSVGPKGEGYPLSLEPAAQEKATTEA